MKLHIGILLTAFAVLVLGNGANGRHNLTIEGIPAASVQEFEQLMRTAHTGVIDKWVESLPSDQQTIAKDFFAQREKQNPTIDI